MRKEENIDIIAVCDVWDKRANDYAEVIKKAGGNTKIFHDYHDLLAIKDIDYVLIARRSTGTRMSSSTRSTPASTCTAKSR